MHAPLPKRPRSRRRLYIAGAALLLIAVIFGVMRYTRTAAAGYQSVTVTRGPITQAVTATGTLNPVVNVQVGSQVSGNIQKLFADFNSKVKEGDIVAQIDPVLFQATVTQVEGELASAQAALRLAQLNAARTEALVAKQNSSQADLDQARATLQQAEATVRIRQGALDKARADLEHCAIRSPVDGVVISRSVDVGQTVAASLQAPVIFTIANDLANMQINTAVAEADVGAIAIDQEVEFTVDAYPNRTFRGKVVQVRNAPTTVQNVVTYDTIIGVNNADLKLKPGMTANVSIIIAHKPDVLRLPNAALRYRPASAAAATASRPPQGRRRGGGDEPRDRSSRTVYVLRGGRPEPTEVKTGISDGAMTEVIEGLAENDAVVSGQLSNAKAGASPGQNPFRGGGRRGF